MRTIITLKPTVDGKVRVTREKLFERFKDRSGRRTSEAAGKGRDASLEIRKVGSMWQLVENGRVVSTSEDRDDLQDLYIEKKRKQAGKGKDAKPTRQMTLAEIDKEIQDGGGRTLGSQPLNFPGGKVRWDALMTARSEKKTFGEDKAKDAYTITQLPDGTYRADDPDGPFVLKAKTLAEIKKKIHDDYMVIYNTSNRGGYIMDRKSKDAGGTSRSYSALGELIIKYDQGKLTRSQLFQKAKEIGFKAAYVRSQIDDPSGNDAKDLFIGTRGLGQERSEGYIDKAYDAGNFNWKVVVGGGFKYSDKISKKTYNVQASTKRSAIEEASSLFYEDFDENPLTFSAVKGSPARDAAPGTKRIVIHNHLPRSRDSYENGLTAKEDELIRKGYKHVTTGNNGWTKIYENDDGDEIRIEFGPQPGQIKSVRRVRDAEHMVAGLTLTAFTKLVNKTAKEMDADSDYHEASSIAQNFGATKEQADQVARELGRFP